MKRYTAPIYLVLGTVTSLLSFWVICSEAIAAEAQAVPIISFHQNKYGAFSSEYTLDVRADGTVIFNGIENVRTPGTREFVVAPQTVRRALRDLVQLKPTLEVQRRTLGPDNYHNPQMSSLTMRAGDTVWSMTFFARTRPVRGYEQMRDILESAFPTRHLRCPYHYGGGDALNASHLPGRSVEVCAYMDAARNALRRQDKEERK
jgi:hypothetical protein